ARVRSADSRTQSRRFAGAPRRTRRTSGTAWTRGQREALEFGIRYERMMVDFWHWVENRES
ncbi:PadR family transcriptional regulator, partial [Streptomyces massasporeus]